MSVHERLKSAIWFGRFAELKQILKTIHRPIIINPSEHQTYREAFANLCLLDNYKMIKYLHIQPDFTTIIAPTILCQVYGKNFNLVKYIYEEMEMYKSSNDLLLCMRVLNYNSVFRYVMPLTTYKKIYKHMFLRKLRIYKFTIEILGYSLSKFMPSNCIIEYQDKIGYYSSMYEYDSQI